MRRLAGGFLFDLGISTMAFCLLHAVALSIRQDAIESLALVALAASWCSHVGLLPMVTGAAPLTSRRAFVMAVTAAPVVTLQACLAFPVSFFAGILGIAAYLVSRFLYQSVMGGSAGGHSDAVLLFLTVFLFSATISGCVAGMSQSLLRSITAIACCPCPPTPLMWPDAVGGILGGVVLGASFSVLEIGIHALSAIRPNDLTPVNDAVSASPLLEGLLVALALVPHLVMTAAAFEKASSQ